MAAPMNAIILCLSFLLHSDVLCLQRLSSRDRNIYVVHENSFQEFSPFVSPHRSFRSVGLYHNHDNQNDNVRRYKRDTISKEEKQLTVPENKTGALYHFPDTSRSYVLVSSSAPSGLIFLSGNTLVVNSSMKLDYEDPAQRTITIVVTGTRNSNDVVETTFVITITNVNDEEPVFRNKPAPFLATVSRNTGPNVIVYEVYAEDPDPNSNITYSLESGAEGRFRLETVNVFDQDMRANIKVGRILTEGQGQFIDGKQYDLVVVAQDVSISPPQRTLATVEVRVGVRPPQFYQENYHGYVFENNGIGQTLQGELKVKAKPFQEKRIMYELLDEHNATSNRFRIDGEGTVFTLQQFDHESVPRVKRPPVYTMKIRATEAETLLSSFADLIVEVMDINDNDPKFEVSQYQNIVPEDITVGSEVARVTANDDDDGTNAELVYSVTHKLFMVETVAMGDTYVGVIKVKENLDYDLVPSHMYNFEISAVDKGVPSRTGTAQVRITTTNVNDNPPELTSQRTIFLLEDKKPGSIVAKLDAVDLDGDTFEFYYTPHNVRTDIFEIIPKSGLITTTALIPKSKDHYALNITITDDGSCCGRNGPNQFNNTYIIIEITDINEVKPNFENCSTYKDIAEVEENAQIGTSVITVSAVDTDRGENGRVNYSVPRSNDHQPLFRISDPASGEITTAVMFDREKTATVLVTVVGRDGGKPTLEGYCTFRVSIRDVNDNAPKFDQTSYRTTIPQAYGKAMSVITVRASDIDVDVNAKVEYSLVPSADSAFFTIDGDIGLILLEQTLMKEAYHFSVMAKDKGTPPLNSTVPVTITVTNRTSKVPTWADPNYDKRMYIVDETAPLRHVITTFSATSNVNNPVLTYHLIDDNGNPREVVYPFRVQTNGNTVSLLVNGAMDYNVQEKYQIRLRVTNRGAVSLSSEIHPTIHLRDTNNKIPEFSGLDKTTGYYPGSVAENKPRGEVVITVKAFDRDQSPPNNVLTYELKDPSNAPGISRKFYLHQDDNNTVIVKSNASFDRENITDSKVYVDIVVKDGAPSTLNSDGEPNSAIATIEVKIIDVNDNPPYFPHSFYNATVREDGVIGSNVILVQARDIDSAASLRYSIYSGNVRSAFTVQVKDGQIMVGRQLDYESDLDPKVYKLEMRVSDGIFHNSTSVHIHVLDVNDNKPVFTNSTYRIVDVVEEDPNISPANKRFLIKVHATDADKNRDTQIRYRILDGIQTDYEINSVTGELYLLKPLDRDLPNGHALYQFSLEARDEVLSPNFGYTTIQIKPIDINDNGPIEVGSLVGYVAENSEPNTHVMVVSFEDYDEGQNGTNGLSYRFIQWESADQDGMFTIDNRGQIQTNTNSENLDRESIAEYKPTIMVEDGGPGDTRKSQTATVTIMLKDENDNSPKFDRKLYKVSMSENQKSGQIVRVVAFDRDIDNNARLTYTLVSHANTFLVDTINNEGSVSVFQPVDYEDENQRFFNITVRVQDPEPTHTDTTTISLTVLDFNDNAPEFSKPLQTKSIKEDVDVGTSIAYFSASDRDSGINKKFTFSIDRKSDPHKLFMITQNGEEGNVTIRRNLDRENEALHVIHILAIDKGDPALTGTSTLSVTVLDVNDNYPIFAGTYRPVVMENDPNYPKLLIKVNGTDLDADPFGPPFGFADNCPSDPVCAFFSLQFQPTGDGGKGWALVSTKAEYDREKTKYYLMQIVMWDMRGHKDAHLFSMSGTNTLTIEIGDENDNKHGPGHKEIFIYNYKGMFGDIEIGNVYATDPDDWDRVDKTFIYTGPEYMKKYFSVDEDTGIIRMLKGVPSEDSPYTFTVRVVDSTWQGLAADCSVTVTIQDLPEEAVFNSGAVRLKGITAEEFVERKKKLTGDIKAYEDSKLDIFRSLLAEKLNLPIANVDIISVMNNGEFTDVRYSVHSSPYYPQERTDTILILHKNQFESEVGIDIAMVPIDECREEMFEGGCYNFLNVTGKPNLINTNGTSLIGVETFVQAKEGCYSELFPPVQECSPTYCLNGGTCKLDDWQELSCECLPGFTGPRCQQTRHSFDGHSFSMFPTLQQCRKGITSVKFITTKENGLIMYNGPKGSLTNYDPRDFISLELFNGYPKLRIDHGTGELVLYVDGRDSHNSVIMQKLNDGKWHQIDIIRDGRDVQMIVDHCEPGYKYDTDVMCRKSGVTPGMNEFLNVDTLLHLGGTNAKPVYPAGLQQTKFDGCIKDFFHNGMMYDLTVKESPGYPSGKPGCSREDDICGVNSIQRSFCGKNGVCEATWNPDSYICVCKPTYRGRQCEIETTVKDMEAQSYFEWHLNNSFFNKLHGVGDWKLQLHIMFRTRDEDGVLITTSSASGEQFITLQIIKGRLTLTYNLDGTNRNLELYYRLVSNGQWHTVEMKRFGREFILKMDNGEGRNFNRTLQDDLAKADMTISTIVHAGAIPSQSSGVTVVDKDLTYTCVNDIRMNNRYFPMQYDENDENNLAASLTKNPHIADGCHRIDCINSTCVEPRICYPLWGLYECRCKPHYEDINGKCLPILYCKNHNCFSGATCVEDTSKDMGYRCECPPGWTGDYCNMKSEAFATAGITTGAIAAIVISVFVLLLLALAVILLVKCVEPKKADDKYILEVDSYDDIRENVINYDEEGAGEEDQEGYDISRLRKPDDTLYKPHDPMMRRDVPLTHAPGETPDVGNFINDRLGDADDDGGAPPHDSVREFVYEGGESDAGSLSSLNTTSSTRSQDYDYLNDWGPKFAKLADMYGAGQEVEED